MSTPVSGSLVLSLSLCVGMTGCQRGPAARLATPPKYELAGQSKCTVQASATRPLVVEWPAADRASLEARLARGLVAVRAEGCDIEVLRQCAVPGSYSYLGLTRKNDQVLITSADELYAQLPIGAARLEGTLARSGKLDVRMALVGMLEAPAEQVAREGLRGDCAGATHVIAGAQLGAFKFYAGGAGEVGAGVAIGGAGAGGKSSASEELLSADGDPQRCDASSTSDTRPPDGCGAVLRIELVRLGDPSCPSGSRWDGQRCVVAQVYCPPGTQPVNGQCVGAPAPTQGCPQGMSFEAGRGCVTGPGPTSGQDGLVGTGRPDPDEALCQEFCGMALRCESEKTGQPLPEGDALAGLKRRCQKLCKFGATDWTRPQIRQCIAGGCATIAGCGADSAR